MPAMRSISLVLSQHAEEAAFHWLLRDRAVRAPHYDLKDLAKLDDRLEAHLDGLRIAGPAGWDIVREELGWEEPGEVFVAAYLAFESGDADRIGAALEVGEKSAELARGVISALGWLSSERAASYLETLIEADDPMRRRMGVGSYAVRRHDPGAILVELLAGEDLLPRTRGLKAVGELGRTDLMPQCQRHYDEEDDEARFWAAWSGALLGDRQAVTPLSELATQGSRRAERAADMAARCMPSSQAVAWSRKLSESDDHQRVAIRIAGAAGDPALVPWLLEMMETDDLARPAGEAFTWITGLDLAYEDLDGEWPEDFEAGPTESPADEDVQMDPDEDLPWPDPELVRAWWQEHQERFPPGTRHLGGAPIDSGTLGGVFRDGRQRLRNAAALEFALQEPTRALFETRAPGPRQELALAPRS